MKQTLSANTAAAVIARYLKARGTSRLFVLCGGHIMPILMRCDLEGIDIVDVRDERSAVHMAHAHAEVTGELGVALVTAGPGVTNAMTGIVNASVSRTPVLIISGTAARQQENRGCIQDLDHPEMLKSVTRYARTVREPTLVLQELDEACSRAQGEGGEPGPAFLDFPLDTLRAEIPPPLQLAERFGQCGRQVAYPAPQSVARAVALLQAASRPLVIAGRGAKRAAAQLPAFLEAFGAAYLDTGESKGILPPEHPAYVAATRGEAMRKADVIVTLGRKLDFQLAYGSPAVFGQAKWIRIADNAGELRDNRRGAVELLADPGVTLEAMVEHKQANPDTTPVAGAGWVSSLRARHVERSLKQQAGLATAVDGSDGLMHPNRLLAGIQKRLSNDALVIADGGDILSFARVALNSRHYMDPGSFGCLGVGVPFGIAAALTGRHEQVVVVTGDGSFGFNAMDIDTAVRFQARVIFVVVNNGAWQIETHDQTENYHRVVGTRLRFSDYAAMGRGLGLTAFRVEKAGQLDDALDAAFATPGPVLIDVLVTPEAVSSDAKLGLAYGFDTHVLGEWDRLERAWRAGSGPT